jgi:hypothetical protein
VNSLSALVFLSASGRANSGVFCPNLRTNDPQNDGVTI